MNAPPALVGRMPVRAGQAAQAEAELAAAVREAVRAVLLGEWTRRLAVPVGEADRELERAAARIWRAGELERQLANRGGWDEV